MKWIYVLMVLVIASLTLGCVGNKETTKAPTTPISGLTTPAGTPAPGSGDDIFGTEGELASVDSLANDSGMDISFSNSI